MFSVNKLYSPKTIEFNLSFIKRLFHIILFNMQGWQFLLKRSIFQIDIDRESIQKSILWKIDSNCYLYFERWIYALI